MDTLLIGKNCFWCAHAHEHFACGNGDACDESDASKRDDAVP